MVLGFFLFASLPLYWLIGTSVFWGLLPFVLAAVAALYYALRRNARDRQILEVLTLTPKQARLVRRNPNGAQQEWQANTYWVTVEMHQTGGPVPFYVTLKGEAREVEIGAFLTEVERKQLFDELQTRLARQQSSQA